MNPEKNICSAVWQGLSSLVAGGFCLLVILLEQSSFAQDREAFPSVVLSVGFTPGQPPFAHDETGLGLVLDLLEAMSAESDGFIFAPKPLYTHRVARALRDGSIELIVFQNKSWGFDFDGVEHSHVLVRDRGAYFSLVSRKTEGNSGLLGATRGFHYAFAGQSIEKLATMPGVFLVLNELDVISLVLHERVGRGVASESLLQWYKYKYPSKGALLNIMEETDQWFDRRFVVLPNARIKSDQLNRLLQSLSAQGILQGLFARYGLSAPAF